MNDNLPEHCYGLHPSNAGKVILVKRFIVGYWDVPGMTPEAADQKNQNMNVSNRQREAMIFGSVFGWNSPAANPDQHPNAKSLVEETLQSVRN